MKPLTAAAAGTAPSGTHAGRRSLGAALTLGAVALPALVYLVKAWSHRWVADDAFIDFRVVENLVAGHGPVYNIGERVEVYTDPLWVAILAVSRVVWFVPLGWAAVVIGLGAGVAGVALASAAAMRLSRLAGRGPALPIGMLVFASVDVAWDFATSGLETGLIFGWAGLSWWLLAGNVEQERRVTLTAFVMGLGVLIRPDLAVVSAAELVALVALSARKAGPLRGRVRSAGRIVAVAAALPVAYQVFRMTYFGLLVPNTALAKSAGAPWWSQGLYYLRDFLSADYLWVPLVIMVPFAALQTIGLARSQRRALALVVAAPVVGGAVDMLYVVRVGGDFMHGRMLLPGLFLLCAAIWVPLSSRPGVVLAAASGLWCAVAVASLHYPFTFRIDHGIANERAFYIHMARNPHPVTISEYGDGIFAEIGTKLRHLAATTRARHPQQTDVILNPTEGDLTPSILLPRNGGPSVLLPAENIGMLGYAAGPAVDVYDELSLANPIGSHTTVPVRTRPGHEKAIGVAWMIARFVPPGTGIPVTPTVYPADVASARTALSCPALRRIVTAVSAPLTPGRAVSNFVHAFGNTTLRFSAIPETAEKQVCG